MPPIGRAAGANGVNARNDAIDDELADPENRDGNEGPDRPQQQDGNGVAALRFKNQPHERRYVLQGLEPFAPGWGWSIGRSPVPA